MKTKQQLTKSNQQVMRVIKNLMNGLSNAPEDQEMAERFNMFMDDAREELQQSHPEVSVIGENGVLPHHVPEFRQIVARKLGLAN